MSTPTLPLDATVSSLIDGDHKWNESLIKEHFTQDDAEHILKIMLPKSPRPDRLIWAYDKHGNYSVTSGYLIALTLKFPNWPSTSRKSPSEWHEIWKLDLPEKVKILM